MEIQLAGSEREARGHDFSKAARDVALLGGFAGTTFGFVWESSAATFPLTAFRAWKSGF
jgi:hypothetical protein